MEEGNKYITGKTTQREVECHMSRIHIYKHMNPLDSIWIAHLHQILGSWHFKYDSIQKRIHS